MYSVSLKSCDLFLCFILQLFAGHLGHPVVVLNLLVVVIVVIAILVAVIIEDLIVVVA